MRCGSFLLPVLYLYPEMEPGLMVFSPELRMAPFLLCSLTTDVKQTSENTLLSPMTLYFPHIQKQRENENVEEQI